MTGIFSSDILCFNLISSSLAYHKALVSEDIIYSSNYLTSFYSHLPFSRKQNHLALFLTYIQEPFALTFNNSLDLAIKSRDNLLLQRLFLGPREMYVELYYNTNLSNIDKSVLLHRLSCRISNNLQLITGISFKSSIICEQSFCDLFSSPQPPSHIYVIDPDQNLVLYLSVFDIVSSLCSSSPFFSDSLKSLLLQRFSKECILYMYNSS